MQLLDVFFLHLNGSSQKEHLEKNGHDIVNLEAAAIILLHILGKVHTEKTTLYRDA